MNREPDWPVRFEGKPPPSRKGILGFSRVFLLSVFSTLGNWAYFLKDGFLSMFSQIGFRQFIFFWNAFSFEGF
jgi:hypothetical protein